jgi:putative two-component system response regulator
MISILSHIVEFRNGESGLHVQHVKIITEFLLRQLVLLTDRYSLSGADIDLISMASAIHDVGKIAIPEEILNKPGKLTAEEFELMKTHSEVGSRMLSDLPVNQVNTPLVKVAYDICRWHHERYDGKGYPDGLKGEEIPISAQVVAIADVYDALTSERCYKKAFSHEEALTMILAGKCGTFNPLLLQCLNEISDKLKNLRVHADEKQKTEETPSMKESTEDGEAPYERRQDVSLTQPEYMKLLYIDSMTGAYNRRYYKEYMQNLPNMEAIAFIDVVNLSRVNNDYGQKAGDLVLQRTAQILLSLIRRNDFLIRYGGDEFLIVFSNMNENVFGERLEEIRHSFDTLIIEEYPRLHTAVSVGGIYGSGRAECFFAMADKMLNQSAYKKGQVTVRFLDKNDADNI